jgi:hypothetical protein
MSLANPGMDIPNPDYKDVQTPRIHANWMPAIHASMTITFIMVISIRCLRCSILTIKLEVQYD